MTAIDADIIQEIMNQPGSMTDKINQLKGYIDGTYPLRFEPDEILDTNTFKSQGICSSRTKNWYYTFVPTKLGMRILHGLFEKYTDTLKGSKLYSARYNKGIIQESFEYYSSAWRKMANP